MILDDDSMERLKNANPPPARMVRILSLDNPSDRAEILRRIRRWGDLILESDPALLTDQCRFGPHTFIVSPELYDELEASSSLDRAAAILAN